MKSNALLPGLAVLALFWGSCKPADVPAPSGSFAPAPSWRLNDLSGNPISSDQYKGKVVVLDFWATWCVPCTKEIPGLIALQNKYAADGLVVIGVAIDEPGASSQRAPAVVRTYVAKHGVSYPIVLADSKVQSAYGGMDAIPTTFIIDREGNIRDKKIGALAADQFERRVLKVLKP